MWYSLATQLKVEFLRSLYLGCSRDSDRQVIAISRLDVRNPDAGQLLTVLSDEDFGYPDISVHLHLKSCPAKSTGHLGRRPVLGQLWIDNQALSVPSKTE